jgi:hypothetical protein
MLPIFSGMTGGKECIFGTITWHYFAGVILKRGRSLRSHTLCSPQRRQSRHGKRSEVEMPVSGKNLILLPDNWLCRSLRWWCRSNRDWKGKGEEGRSTFEPILHIEFANTLNRVETGTCPAKKL